MRRLILGIGCALAVLFLMFIGPALAQVAGPSQSDNGAQIQFDLPQQGEQMACYDKIAAMNGLALIFDEKVVARGIHVSGSLLEILVSEAGSFTILITEPERTDRVCVLAFGLDFEVGGALPSNGVNY